MSSASSSPRKESQSWSHNDLACTNCRTRKIRCGREKPQCDSCKRDGVKCQYASPGKRVNHVKLLCQNFDNLEDKLSDIQCGISLLTSLVKGSRNNESGESHLAGASLDEEEGSAVDNNDSILLPSNDGHVVRDDSEPLERYHSPGSLFALCKEFTDTAASSALPSSSNETPTPTTAANHESLSHILQTLCADAGRESNPIPSHPTADFYKPIRPPPRQFLSMVIDQFFSSTYYARDIFEQGSFQTRVVDRIYNQQPLSQPADEAWAVCFNLIILLTLGADQSTRNNDPFIQPFLQTLHAAGTNPRVFLSPRLVHVQALVLLSIAAEQYSSPGFAESMFAQACMMARTIGLHRPRATDDTTDPVEAVERRKVLRSLYIRDKQGIVSKGSMSWLPGADLGMPSSRLLDDDSVEPRSNTIARMELSILQDEIQRPRNSSSHRPESRNHGEKLAVLEQKLETWAQAYKVNKINRTASPLDGIEMYLSFLATRIYLLRGSLETRCIRQVTKDSRTSCLLFLAACTKSSNPTWPEKFTELLLTSSPGLDFLCDGSTLSELEGGSGATFHRLAAAFPISALFTLAKNCLASRNAPLAEEEGEEDCNNCKPEREGDLDILEALRDLYRQNYKSPNQVQPDTLTSKISRTLTTVVNVIYLLRQGHMSPEEAQADLAHPQPSHCGSSLLLQLPHHNAHFPQHHHEQQQNSQPPILPPGTFNISPSSPRASAMSSRRTSPLPRRGRRKVHSRTPSSTGTHTRSSSIISTATSTTVTSANNKPTPETSVSSSTGRSSNVGGGSTCYPTPPSLEGQQYSSPALSASVLADSSSYLHPQVGGGGGAGGCWDSGFATGPGMWDSGNAGEHGGGSAGGARSPGEMDERGGKRARVMCDGNDGYEEKQGQPGDFKMGMHEIDITQSAAGSGGGAVMGDGGGMGIGSLEDETMLMFELFGGGYDGRFPGDGQ